MRLTITAFALAAACVTTACDDSSSPASPSSFINGLNTMPAGFPQLTWFMPHRCSSVVPELLPVTLHVTAGTFPVALTEVRFQSLDPFRSTAPPTIFDTASLTRQFGSISIQSFAVRHFPFTFPIGCVRGAVLQTSVTTTDNGGVSRVQTMQMPMH